ncbi:MAG: hypothetical protein ACFB16_01795 [Phormidesmis sp.]
MLAQGHVKKRWVLETLCHYDIFHVQYQFRQNCSIILMERLEVRSHDALS